MNCSRSRRVDEVPLAGSLHPGDAIVLIFFVGNVFETGGRPFIFWLIYRPHRIEKPIYKSIEKILSKKEAGSRKRKPA